MGRPSSLVEVVPKDTGGILDNTHVGCNVRFIILHYRHTLVFPGLVEELAEVIESRETPVALISSKSVRCDYKILA